MRPIADITSCGPLELPRTLSPARVTEKRMSGRWARLIPAEFREVTEGGHQRRWLASGDPWHPQLDGPDTSLDVFLDPREVDQCDHTDDASRSGFVVGRAPSRIRRLVPTEASRWCFARAKFDSRKSRGRSTPSCMSNFTKRCVFFLSVFIAFLRTSSRRIRDKKPASAKAATKAVRRFRLADAANAASDNPSDR